MMSYLSTYRKTVCSGLYRVLGAGVLAAMPLSVVYAQEGDGPAAIYIGAFDVVPSVQLDVREDDNVNQSAAGLEQSSQLTVLRPSISATADDGIIAYEIEYSLEDSTYDDASNNDSTSQSLSFSVDWNIDVRHALEFRSSYEDTHEDRSADSVTGAGLTDLNEFEDTGLNLRYTYGASGATGRIAVGYTNNSTRYTTNRAFTNVLDNDSESVDFTFSLQASPASRVFIRTVQSETSFASDAQRNREEISNTVGFAWEFTGVTKGTAQFGVSNSDLINATGDNDRVIGDVSIEWQAYPYSIWTLTAQRTSEDGDNVTQAFIDRRSYSLAWQHSWTDHFSSTLTTRLQADNFINDVREDETSFVELKFDYGIRRWLKVGFGWSFEELDSNNDTFDFEKNIATLSLTATL